MRSRAVGVVLLISKNFQAAFRSLGSEAARRMLLADRSAVRGCSWSISQEASAH
jgi:hypothetical protein